MKKILPVLSLMILVAALAPSFVFAGDGTIKLRVVAVNPSKEKPQTVPIKIYMPKEVIPDDIIEVGELRVGYDREKGVYYATNGRVELKPQETRVFEVALEDVWRVRDPEMEKIRSETKLALKHLENTEYFSKAKAIADSIDRRLTEIAAKQSDDSISREEHIGAYRVNILIMDQIRQDLATLEKLRRHTGAPHSVEFLKGRISEKKENIGRINARKLRIAILGFLGLIGAAFCARRLMKMKKTKDTAAEKKGSSKPASLTAGEHGDDSKTKKAIDIEEEAEEVDIEKLMEPEDKDKREAG